MTSPGGPSMDYGDDYVAARLSVDVPEGSNAAVRELSDGVERFRTAMEASVRAGADMNRYLDQMVDAQNRAAEAQKNMTNQLAAYQQLQARMGGGGQAPSSGVPLGTAQEPWAGVTAGMGGSRPPDPADVYYQLRQGSNTQPREYLNAQAARGGVSPAESVSLSAASIASLAAAIAARDHAGKQEESRHSQSQAHATPGQQDPYAQFQNRAAGGIGLAQSMLNEVGGGNGFGLGGMALQGVNALRHHLMKKQAARQDSGAPSTPDGGDPSDGSNDDSSMGLSGAIKGAGIAGGALTALMGIGKIIQSGGAMVAGDRAIGNLRGGAGGEGFQASLRARQIGLDPTLSTDQGRQIIQAEIAGGYADASGKETMPGVTDFFKNNIKTFNVDPSQSLQMLNMSAHGTRLSLDELTSTLSALKTASASSIQDLPQLTQNTITSAQQMVAQGVTPNAAMSNALSDSLMFKGDPQLEGTFNSGVSSSEQGMMRMYGGMNIPAAVGASPHAQQRWMKEHGGDQQARMNMYMRIAKQCKGNWDHSNGDESDPGFIRSSDMFATRMAGLQDPEYGQDYDKAVALYKKLIWSGKTAKQLVDQDKQDKKDATAGDRQVHEIDPPKQQGFFERAWDNFTGHPRKPGDKGYTNNTLDRIRSAYGGHDDQIEVMKDGKVVGNLDVHNKDMIDKLSNGEYQWRHKNDKGKGIDLSDTPEGTLGGDYSTDHPTDHVTPGGGKSGSKDGKSSDGNANNVTTIELGPQAQQLFQIINPPKGPSSNDVGANRGDPGASKNNPPARAPNMGPGTMG